MCWRHGDMTRGLNPLHRFKTRTKLQALPLQAKRVRATRSRALVCVCLSLSSVSLWSERRARAAPEGRVDRLQALDLERERGRAAAARRADARQLAQRRRQPLERGERIARRPLGAAAARARAGRRRGGTSARHLRWIHEEIQERESRSTRRWGARGATVSRLFEGRVRVRGGKV